LGKYRWIYMTDEAGNRVLDERGHARSLDHVGINDDGTVHNPNGYPEELVREQVKRADARWHEKRSKAAKKAAVTRSIRIEKETYRVAKQILDGRIIGPLNNCAICGKGLGDPESIHRGIGSECWQNVLKAYQKLRYAPQRFEPMKETTP
jgi:hypothetical protein